MVWPTWEIFASGLSGLSHDTENSGLRDPQLSLYGDFRRTNGESESAISLVLILYQDTFCGQNCFLIPSRRVIRALRRAKVKLVGIFWL